MGRRPCHSAAQLGCDDFWDVQGNDCFLEKDLWVTGITNWIRVNNNVLIWNRFMETFSQRLLCPVLSTAHEKTMWTMGEISGGSVGMIRALGKKSDEERWNRQSFLRTVVTQESTSNCQVCEREGITCTLCLWWIKQGIKGFNCSRAIKIRCWEKVLIEILKHCTRFLGEVVKFHPWRDFSVLDIDYSQTQRQQWSTHLLEMPLTFCYCELQKTGLAIKGVAKKWDSCLDLRCGRFLLWTFPDRQQCLRSHLNRGVYLQGFLFLPSRTSWFSEK